MEEIIINQDTLQKVQLVSRVTSARVRDCVEEEDIIVFIIEKGDISLAVGRKGEHIARLKKLFSKTVQMVEFSEDPKLLLKNIFRNYGVTEVDIEEKDDGQRHATVHVDGKEKGRAIGKNARNLKRARNIVARHHNIGSVSVS